MDFLKNRPGLQLVLNGMIVFLVMLLMFWIQSAASKDNTVISDVENLKLNKADVELVNNQNDDIESLKRDKADVSWVGNEIKIHAENDRLINAKQDAKVEKMRIEWREDHKEILTLIRGL
jgi:hypothetical protein